MTGIEEKRKIGELLREEILKQLIEPSYYTDVNETIRGRKCWRVSGHVFESMSKILLAVSGVLSFAAGVYDDKILSFVAGTLSTTSLACFQFSLYSLKMHKKNSLELNQLLEKLNIDTVPIFESMRTEPGQGEQDTYDHDIMMRAAPNEDSDPQKMSLEAVKIDIEEEEKLRKEIQERKEKLIEMVKINERSNFVENEDKN